MRKFLFRLLIGLVAVAMGLVTAACSPVGTTGPMSGPYTRTVWGPDVSNYQHPYGAAINWNLVRGNGARFAFVKMSEGNSYTNPYAKNDIKAARAAGLYVGVYHFARPRLPLSTAASDAKLFAAQLGNVRVAGYLPPVLDVEMTGGLSAANVTAWTRSFLSTLQAATGRVPMIYSGSWFWRGYMGNPKGFSQYPVWIAEYTPKNTGPSLFSDFGYSTFWQYSSTARVSGISGAVDASWFHGTQAQLNSLAWGATQPAVKTAAARTATTSRMLANIIIPPTTPGADATSAGATGSRMAQDPATVGH
jgi:lysozyme